ncbi:3'-5' exoribonuclease YhaM [Macrococcoides bohemicum]|uniref:3'-5' exoribonuclease YhaM n=1 Tax=Macrococcoides bohemicum TaxID=1903056 RepID=A0AAE7Q6K7_9STAP|nr:3'-5' exoribonuclease YhaM [Macrococcus bohemicus]MBC9875494.1 3'-5' exoribonuclease YhaM [Macrococcus bohemicus]QRN50448.1 3'-5' exoribonuclease YhaM [Macrococcus bohemicus]QYA41871.1 3'-5' exoribonuclease YhaM [Macrococcus bohemicus]QYA44295.1 3'-5' exoribonuclease YhaM [Macrococcus bohemicus]
MRTIETLKPGASVDNYFLIHKAIQGVTGQGKPYLTLYLKDKSGDLEAKVWTVTEDDIKALTPETLVRIKGDVIDYRGRIQMKVNQFKVATPEDGVKLEHFLESAPLSEDDMMNELMDYLLEIENAKLQRVTRLLLKKHQNEFMTFPAASSNHHNFVSGLLYHVLTMLKQAKALCDIYPSLNKSLLYSGIILHDLGKVKELSGPVATSYTVEGNLLGHISIMSDEVASIAREHNIDGEEIMLLRHLILSHHGKYEYGSPKLPMVKEAEILNFIDNIDARMQMFDKHMKKVEKGNFSERIFALENRQFYKPINLD